MSTKQLNEAEIRALNTALDDEYLSWTTYDQVINDFGEIQPFLNIRDAEHRHIQALGRLYQRYGVAMPENTYPGKVDRFASVQEACQAAVEGEIANGAMYEELFQATDREDILQVLRRLQEASVERHLPAFQRCAEQGGSGGNCAGRGHGRGGGGRRRNRAP